MAIDNQKIKEILLKENYVTEEDIKKAEGYAKKHRGSIVDYLISERVITKELLGQAIAESFKVAYADLKTNQPARDQVLKIPEQIARRFHVVLFKEEAKNVILTSDAITPASSSTELLEIFKPKKIIFAYSFPEDIEAVFSNYRKPLESRFVEIIREERRVAPEIITEIIEDALANRASDIHFEPQEKEVVIRFRIDGVLHEAGRIPKDQYENILNRLKVQAHLRIDEHFSAQDGAMRHIKDGKSIDLRISIVPTLDGEKIAIRLLSEYVRSFTLSDLGLAHDNQEIITQAAKKPFGMILVVGPTGSGKTTTLYAVLKLLNNPGVNITTIEDPVEYKIVGINQIQVNPQTNLTFAKGLRSIARQDPNIILVGEIRDRETAEIAINAALTGHLLLSTFHANDAATALPRLLDMEVEPFLLASTLQLVIAQRLTRKICETCRYSVTFSQEEIKKILPAAQNYFGNETITLYKGKGCDSCGQTGYKGRIAIFELIVIDPDMQDLILQSASTKQIWQLASSQGARSLFDDGIEKVKNGITTLEELLRVASPIENQIVYARKTTSSQLDSKTKIVKSVTKLA